MELFCALLTGFFLWLFVFHFFCRWRARVREEAGPLLLEVKAATRIIRAFRWLSWIGIVVQTAMMATILYLMNRIMSALGCHNFPAVMSYEFASYCFIIIWSFFLFNVLMPPYWPRIALEVRERGILSGNHQLRLWSGIAQCRWFLPKTRFGVSAFWRTPWPYNRFRFTIRERSIAAGQKEAVTAMLARFVQVYDHDGTLLAGPSQAERAARAAQPVQERTRSWLQFDLQSLLLLAVVVSCGASCYAIHDQRLQPHRRAVAQLEKFGAAISFFGNVPYDVDFSKCVTKPTDDDLACLEWLDQLYWVDLSGSPITDAGIAHLKGLRYLRYVNCRGTGVTAKGAEELHRELPNAAIIYGQGKKRVMLKPADEK